MSSRPASSKRLAFLFCLIALIATAIGLRAVDLRSDPYAKLDWDTGILTDEGFYTHNARNVVLFGQPRMDEFNNMLVSPLVHCLQVGVFSVFGFGVVQARMISVVLSILTLIPFFAALRIAFGVPIAVTATIFLALDHVNVLFNRMALIDTPATFLAVLAFYVFVRGMLEMERGSKEQRRRVRGKFWFGVCGALIGLAVITRPLCVYLFPAPFVALWVLRRGPASESWVKRAGGITAFGLVLVAAIYFVTWYRPNMAELNHMSHYYRTVQIQPHSIGRLLHNIYIAFVGGEYGIVPYLWRHTPVILVLAVLGMVIGKRPSYCNHEVVPQERQKLAPDVILGISTVGRAAHVFLATWFLTAFAVFAISNYSPDRYFVSMLPAMFALAAVGVWRPLESWRLCSRTASKLAAAAIAMWLTINAVWLGDWWRHREYTQIAMTDWLNNNVSADSILLGDVGPGLGIETRFQTVNVMEGLCNDKDPIKRYEDRKTYIMLIDGSWRGPYWVKRYPELIDPERRILHARVLKWRIGIYPVSSTSKTSASELDASGMRRR